MLEWLYSREHLIKLQLCCTVYSYAFPKELVAQEYQSYPTKFTRKQLWHLIQLGFK